MIRLKIRNGFWRMRPQSPYIVQNKRQGIRQRRAFNRKKSKAVKSRLRALILIFIPACQWKQHALLVILQDSGRDQLTHFC